MMKQLIRLSTAVVAAMIGALLGAFIAGAYVNVTYHCAPQPADPCDAGAMLGFGLTIILSPILALICGGVGYWTWGRRQSKTP